MRSQTIFLPIVKPLFKIFIELISADILSVYQALYAFPNYIFTHC
nr:MAG TPA: hypothetical protein [Caudoviricetes sp.]